jgi:hypothetical protein
MSLPRAHESFAAEFEDHLSGADGANDVCIDICNCITGDFERERPALWMSIILAKLLKIIVYLTINVGQMHLCS